MNEEIKIEDGSGDKEFFTIVPNYILNHSTIWDREVYIQMKRIAGEKGECYMSVKNLVKQCGISRERLKNSIKYLIEHKWITSIEKKPVETKGGVQFLNTYKINNIWKLNSNFYHKGGSPDDTPCDKGGSPDERRGVAKLTKGGRQMTTNKINLNKNHINKNYVEKDKFLTDLLYNLIKQNYPFLKEKDNSKDYAEMNKLNRIDKWEYKQIEYVIRWSQRDEFWKQNIRSVKKLRIKFEELVVRIKSQGEKNQVVKI